MLMSMKNMGSDVGSESVQLANYDFFHEHGSGEVFSGVKFDNDGNLYVLQSTGSYGLVTAWLVKGSASGFYLSRSIFSGSLDTDAGTGWLVLSTDREYNISRAFLGVKRATVDFQISSESDGDPVLVEGRIVMSVEQGFP